MAFGFKVRKVNMMRGNRQGNNAFMEDPKHEHQTPIDYLMKTEELHMAFSNDLIEETTFRAL